MPLTRTSPINNNTIKSLKENLYFLHVNELRHINKQLSLSNKGNKKTLILRATHYLLTGQELSCPKFPKESYAQPGMAYEPTDQTLMLIKAYKNDLKNRNFFKKIIGNHFHFTAYGIDWLNDQWLQGTPPTYHQFANMWQQEYLRRQNSAAPPKKEWAYINFVQNHLQHHPMAHRKAIDLAWKQKREQCIKTVQKILNTLVLIQQ